MTPHGVLEDMSMLERAAGPKSVHFEFGAVAPLPEHQQFANALLDRGMFRLPFTTVFLTGSAIPKTGIVATQEIADGRLARLTWFTVAPAIFGDIDMSLPLMSGELVGDDLATGMVNWRSLTTVRHGSRKTGRTWDDTDYEAAADKALLFVLSTTVLLMSKDVEVETETPSDRMNRRRLAKGKPLIGVRRMVSIKLDHRRAYATSVHDFRASPRMHWRRGHFRQLQSGTVVPVAPTIVNASPDSKPAAKAYEVTS